MSKTMGNQWVGLQMDLLQDLHLIEFVRVIRPHQLLADMTYRWCSVMAFHSEEMRKETIIERSSLDPHGFALDSLFAAKLLEHRFSNRERQTYGKR